MFRWLLILSFIIETHNVVGVVVGILVPLLMLIVLVMVLVAVLAIFYRKQLHSWYRHWKSKKYQLKDDPKKTTEVVVLSDKRPITWNCCSKLLEYILLNAIFIICWFICRKAIHQTVLLLNVLKDVVTIYWLLTQILETFDVFASLCCFY